jgi:N-acylneuraminate cytidylyltransferase
MYSKENQKAIAFIPARSGSLRVKNKNIMNFYNHPLIAYSIQSAINANIFDQIFVLTDCSKIASIAKYYGAEVPFIRPKKISGSLSPDIDWVKYTFQMLNKQEIEFDYFSILRPTTPQRKVSLIRNAFETLKKNKQADSIRAVSLCKEHPGKMWSLNKKFMKPLLTNNKIVEFHARQYQDLPEYYYQNSSLEFAKTHCVTKYQSKEGKNILPLVTTDYEGLSIDTRLDVESLKILIDKKIISLPKIRVKKYNS